MVVLTPRCQLKRSLLPSHPLVPTFDTLVSQIAQILADVKMQGFAVDVLQRRQTQEPRKDFDDTALCITGTEVECDNWKAAGMRIHELFVCIYLGIWVELLNADLHDGLIEGKRGVDVLEGACMGSSIAVEGQEPGTLGSFFTLKKSGEEMLCALTCGPVLHPPTSEHGNPPGVINVHQPAPGDLDAAIAEKEHDLELCKAR